MPDLLLLTIDSLRADHFDRNRFPQCWDVFDSEFARFENAMANGVATPLSFPSIHTGRPAIDGGMLSTEFPTIAELYDGYTRAVSNNPHLRPDRNYNRGFEFFIDNLKDKNDDVAERKTGILATGASKLLQTASNILAQTVPESEDDPDLTPPPSSAAHVIDELRTGMDDHNGFFWAHFIDPHYQFKPQKVLDRELTVGYTNREILAINERFIEGSPNSDDIEFLMAMYEEQIGYLDRQLADFFDYLRSENRWYDTMIIIMSDHGEAFGEEGIYNHQWDADPIDPLINVPLLVKFPSSGSAEGAYEHRVQNADLLATLIREFGWERDYPPNTHPLTEAESRTIVSKSTTAIRVTTDTGYAIRRRDESVDINGTVGNDAMEILNYSTIPAIEKLSGNIPGLDEQEQQEMKKHLERLGYR